MGDSPSLVTKHFDPSEARDDHGRWSLVGAVEHAVAGATKPAKGAPKDRLKLADRIHLDPGEHLHGSARVNTDTNGSVLLAGIDKDGQRHLRVGVGNGSYGTRDSDHGLWAGMPHDTAGNKAHNAEAAAERERLESRWDDLHYKETIDRQPLTDAERAEKTSIEHHLDQIEDTPEAPEWADGFTSHLEPAQAQQLRTVLADLHAKGVRAEADENARWDEIEKLREEQAELGGPDGFDPDEWDDPDAERARLDQVQQRLQELLPAGENWEYLRFGQGVIPGRWGDIHYEGFLDDGAIGAQVHLAVVPHDRSRSLDDMDEEQASLSMADVGKLVKHLGEILGPAGKSVVADVVKWGFDPTEPRSTGGRWTAGSDSGVTVTTKPSKQQLAQQAARQRQDAAAARTAGRQKDAAELADVQARLTAATSGKQKSTVSAAVAAQRKALGIPSGKKFNALSPAAKAAAQQVLAATKAIAQADAATAKQNALIAALNKELQAGGRDHTTQWLKQRLATAQAKLTNLAAQRKTASDQLAAGRKAWRAHHR